MPRHTLEPTAESGLRRPGTQLDVGRAVDHLRLLAARAPDRGGVVIADGRLRRPQLVGRALEATD